MAYSMYVVTANKAAAVGLSGYCLGPSGATISLSVTRLPCSSNQPGPQPSQISQTVEPGLALISASGQTQPPGAVQAEISHVVPPWNGVAGGIGMTLLLRLPLCYLEQYVRRRAFTYAWLWLCRIAATKPLVTTARRATAAMNMNMVHLSRKE